MPKRQQRLNSHLGKVLYRFNQFSRQLSSVCLRCQIHSRQLFGYTAGLGGQEGREEEGPPLLLPARGPPRLPPHSPPTLGMRLALWESWNPNHPSQGLLSVSTSCSSVAGRGRRPKDWVSHLPRKPGPQSHRLSGLTGS